MILIITNREDITADYVILELKKRNKKYFRFNTEDFPNKISVKIDFKEGDLDGKFIINDKENLYFSEIESIWYRRPSLPKIISDNEGVRNFAIKESLNTLNGIWDNINSFWVSRPRNIYYAENKITQLKYAKEIGFKIPPTIIASNYHDIKSFYEEQNREVIIKPVKTGLIQNNEVIFTSKIEKDDIEKLKLSNSFPSKYQANIKKSFDIRVTIIGNKIFPVEIHSQNHASSKIDWRKTENLEIPHYKHKLPRDIEEKCLTLLKKFGLEFGAIDLILATDNNYYFLEINPNGQWAWIEERVGYKLTEALVDLLIRR